MLRAQLNWPTLTLSIWRNFLLPANFQAVVAQHIREFRAEAPVQNSESTHS